MRGLVSALPLGANRPPLGQAGSPSLCPQPPKRMPGPLTTGSTRRTAPGMWEMALRDGGWYFPVWEMYVRKQCFMNMLMLSPRSRSWCAELAPGIKDG